MRIRHIIAVENLDPAGWIVDPLLVRHGVVVAGRIAHLAGPIDPLTHLNLDFTEHRLDVCLVAERLEDGAALLWEGERFRIAHAHPTAFSRLGSVNVDLRRAQWQQHLNRRR